MNVHELVWVSSCQHYEHQHPSLISSLCWLIVFLSLASSLSLVLSIPPSIPTALWVLLMHFSGWVLDLISRDLQIGQTQQGGPCFYNERADKEIMTSYQGEGP